MSLCDPRPIGHSLGWQVGLLSKHGPSEIWPKLFQSGNKEGLSRLLSGDGNRTHNQGLGQGTLKRKELNTDVYKTSGRDEEARPPAWASSGSQDNTVMTHPGSSHLGDTETRAVRQKHIPGL